MDSPMKTHPLGIASRYMDADTEEHGLAEAVRRQDLEIEDVIYAAEQRALRCVLAFVGRSSELGNHANPRAIQLNAEERTLMSAMTLASLDGLVIGWRAHSYREANRV